MADYRNGGKVSCVLLFFCLCRALYLARSARRREIFMATVCRADQGAFFVVVVPASLVCRFFAAIFPTHFIVQRSCHTSRSMVVVRASLVCCFCAVMIATHFAVVRPQGAWLLFVPLWFVDFTL